MGRDFGDDTLPLSNMHTDLYLATSRMPVFQISTWNLITLVLGHLLSSCVAGAGKPGWTARVGSVVVLVVPLDSEIRRRFWSPAPEIGGSVSNSSGLLTSS